MFLILLAEIAGSSMDAIVRFLQQGGRGMHPFQVSETGMENVEHKRLMLITLGDRCAHGHDLCAQYHLHVVDQGT
jgi:hypothetical protein